MTRYTGKIIGSAPRTKVRVGKRSVTVELDGLAHGPTIGDTVEVRVVLTDEKIGERLRAMLTQGDGIDRDSILNLADEISDNSGWPVLADLIRDVGL